MSKKEWKLSWQRARLNRRYAEQSGYEFYKDSNTQIASNIYWDVVFQREFGL